MGETRSLSPTPLGPEGPFFLPNQPVRSDIREDRDGLPFTIQFNLKDFNNEGKPLANAQVNVWHADALGVYSAYLGLYPLEKRGISGENHVQHTDDTKFLRGIQYTDEEGKATFQTVFPGWYGARTPHIHFKVFVNDKDCYTGEVYFQDSLVDDIAKNVKPYSDRDATNKKTNDSDPLFGIHSGFKTVVEPEGNILESLRGVLNVVVQTA